MIVIIKKINQSLLQPRDLFTFILHTILLFWFCFLLLFSPREFSLSPHFSSLPLPLCLHRQLAGSLMRAQHGQRTQRGCFFSPLADRAECSGNVKGHLVDEYEGRPLITTLSMTNKEVLVDRALACIVLWRTRDILSLAARTPASEPALEKLFVWP